MSSKITLLREMKEGEKLAPQCKVIYEELKKVGVGKAIEREELIKRLEGNSDMKTRQPVGRILAYYTKPMKDEGLISTETGARESAKKNEGTTEAKGTTTGGPAAEKPAKPAKAA